MTTRIENFKPYYELDKDKLKQDFSSKYKTYNAQNTKQEKINISENSKRLNLAYKYSTLSCMFGFQPITPDV